MNDEQAREDLKWVTSYMVFGYICPYCSEYNTVSWSNYAIYGDIRECNKCERAVKVNEPWR